MNSWSTVTWTVARASGFAAFALLTLAVVLGLALSMRWQRPSWPRLITNDLHGFLTLLSLVFLTIHVLAVWIDPFTRFNWREVFIPFLSHYRTLYMALGIVAAYLALAVWISTQLRPWIGFTWWRRLHGLSFGAYLLALFHGLGTGSDTRTLWGIGIYLGSASLIGMLLIIRLMKPIGARGRTYPNLAALTALVLGGGVLWTVTGPWQPGWNAIANNGRGSGARTNVAGTSAASPSTPAPISFTTTLQGTLTQSNPDPSGAMTIHLTATPGGGQGSLDVLIQGNLLADGEVAVTGTQVTLVPPNATLRYQGSAQLQGATGEWLITGLLSPPGTATNQFQVRICLQPAADGQVTGTMEGTPASSGTPAPPRRDG